MRDYLPLGGRPLRRMCRLQTMREEKSALSNEKHLSVSHWMDPFYCAQLVRRLCTNGVHDVTCTVSSIHVLALFVLHVLMNLFAAYMRDLAASRECWSAKCCSKYARHFGYYPPSGMSRKLSFRVNAWVHRPSTCCLKVLFETASRSNCCRTPYAVLKH